MERTDVRCYQIKISAQLWLAKLLDEEQSRKHEAARFQSEDRRDDVGGGVGGYCCAGCSGGIAFSGTFCSSQGVAKYVRGESETNWSCLLRLGR